MTRPFTGLRMIVCLVQTVDVFTPCVDDPRLFGKICAANCLSDIYAMGGEPRTALSVLAFPSETLPGEIIFQMLAGAMEVFKQAGVALIGGHSVKDEEIKLGFAITGLINPAVAAALDKPKAGDALVLTKPLGTGRAGVLPPNRARLSGRHGGGGTFHDRAEPRGGGGDEGSGRVGLHGHHRLRPLRASAADAAAGRTRRGNFRRRRCRPSTARWTPCGRA